LSCCSAHTLFTLNRRFLFVVDWYYIFSILPLRVYPCSPDIYNDVKKAQELGYQIPPEFIHDLRKASGRQE